MHLNQKIKVAVLFFAWIAYPITILLGLKYFSPRYVALMLGLLLIVKWRRDASFWIKSLAKINILILIALLATITMIFIFNSEDLLLLYPALVNLSMLILFATSLKFPPSIIESFARIGKPNLATAGVRYTNNVTKIWCLFFIANGAISLYTVYFCNQGTWALYNGLVAYMLMGMLFAVEWLIRQKHLVNPSKD